MEITSNKAEGTLTIFLEGRMDTIGAQELTDKITLEERKGFDLVLDFAKLQYISSAGLRALIVFKKDAEAEGKTLKITHVNPVVTEIFQATGFNRFLNIE